MEGLFLVGCLIAFAFLLYCADVLEKGGRETDEWFGKYSVKRDMINARHQRGEITWEERKTLMDAIEVD